MELPSSSSSSSSSAPLAHSRVFPRIHPLITLSVQHLVVVRQVYGIEWNSFYQLPLGGGLAERQMFVTFGRQHLKIWTLDMETVGGAHAKPGEGGMDTVGDAQAEAGEGGMGKAMRCRRCVGEQGEMGDG